MSDKSDIELTDGEHSLVDKTMEGLDCAMIAKAMKAVGWEWYGPGQRLKIPDAAEVEACARELLRDCMVGVRNGPWAISCGGLTAEYIDDCLSIHFTLAASNSKGDE